MAVLYVICAAWSFERERRDNMYVCMYVIVISVIVGLIYVKLKRHYTYWDTKGVKGPKPYLLIGNLNASYTTSIVSECYKQYPEEKYVGIYEGLSPALIIRDPRLVKQVFIKDFPSFADRGYSVLKEPILRNLIFEDGAHWRILRQRLTPMFTSGKLRQMMPLLSSCAREYMKYVNDIVERNNTNEIREINGKYTLKCIICCAFGLDIDTFSEKGKEFTEAANELLNVCLRIVMVAFIDNVIPGLLTKLNIIKYGKRNVIDFFFNLTRKIIKEREVKPKVRRDFMDLMIEMKEEGSVTKSEEDGNAELEITDEVIVAQAIAFYVAGFETSSGAMSFLFYELALNPSIQERCYLEIKEVMEKYNGELTYDAVKELKYVSMALDEGLRKYPVIPRLARKSTAEYTFPGTNLTIQKDVRLIIPVLALHKDPKYFPEPDKFDPERFAPENKHKIQDCTYLPFGEGPRQCIGMRFARVQSLLGIAHFLYNFRLEPSETTPDQLAYKFQALTLSNERGIWLNVKRR